MVTGSSQEGEDWVVVGGGLGTANTQQQLEHHFACCLGAPHLLSPATGPAAGRGILMTGCHWRIMEQDVWGAPARAGRERSSTAPTSLPLRPLPSQIAGLPDCPAVWLVDWLAVSEHSTRSPLGSLVEILSTFDRLLPIYLHPG